MKNISKLALVLSLTIASIINVNAQNGKINIYKLNSNFNSNPYRFTPAKDKMYFIANDSIHGYELWSVDSINPPVRITDLMPGKEDGVRTDYNTPYPLTKMQMGAIGNSVYFVGIYKINTSKNHGFYEYGSTTHPILIDSFITEIAGTRSYNSILYMVCRRKSEWGLYSYNPSISKLTKLDGIGSPSPFIWQYPIFIFNNKVFYSKYQFEKLYEYDINSGIIKPHNNMYGCFNIFRLKNKNYYVLRSNSLYNLYYIDRIGGLTKPLVGLNNQRGFYNISYHEKPIIHQSKIYFSGTVNTTQHIKLGLFSYDINTTKLEYIDRTLGIYTPWNLYATNLEKYNGKIFFNANTSTGNKLCYYDIDNDTGSKIEVLPNIYVSNNPTQLTRFKNVLFFATKTANNSGYELAKYTEPITTSITKTKARLSAYIYPNPARNLININLKLNDTKKVAIHILDITGKYMYRGAIHKYSKDNHNAQVLISNLPPGTYICNLINKNMNVLYSEKFIKE